MVILCFFVSVPLRQQRVGLDIAGIARDLAVAAAAEAGAAAVVLYSHTAEGAVAQRKLSAVLRRDNGELRILVVDGQFRVFAVHRHIEASVAARDRQRNALGDEVHTIDPFPAGRQRHRPAGQLIGGPLPVDSVIHILIQRDGLFTVRRVRRLDGSGKGRVPARLAADGQRRRHLFLTDTANALAVRAAVVRMRHDLDIFQLIHSIIGHSLIITCSVIRRALRQQVGKFVVAVASDLLKCAAGELDFGGVKIREDKRAAGDRARDRRIEELNAAMQLIIGKVAAADVRDAAAVEFDITSEGTALGVQRTVHLDGGVGKCDALLHRRRAVDGRTFIAAAGKGHVRVFSDRHILGGVRSALQRQRAGQRHGGAESIHIPQQGQRRLGAALIAPAVQGLDGLYIAVFQRTVFREVGSLGRAVGALGGNFRVQFLVAHRAYGVAVIGALMDALRELHLVRCIAGQVHNFGALINDAPCTAVFAVQLALRVVGSQQVFNGEALALIVIRELADGAGVCIAIPQLQIVACACGAARSIA